MDHETQERIRKKCFLFCTVVAEGFGIESSQGKPSPEMVESAVRHAVGCLDDLYSQHFNNGAPEPTFSMVFDTAIPAIETHLTAALLARTDTLVQ